MRENDGSEVELEEQFILRLPMQEANKVRGILQTKPEKLKKTLKIDIDVAKGSGTVNVGKKKLHAYLKKMPTIIESYKTNIANDKKTLFKTADVSHMLECFDQPLKHIEKVSRHGYTPPLKNVCRRFRKTLVNPEVAEETEVIAKELYYLLSADFAAVGTRYELIYEDIKGGECNSKGAQTESMLFGHFSSGSDSEIDVVKI